jgi:glutamate synthase domain-containing protein 2
MGRINSLEESLKLQEKGYLVYPDPSDPTVAENFKNGKGPIFEKIGKLPIWNEEILKNRIEHLRELGAERICFKTGPFDPKDLIRILKIASENEVDLVTFDGAGGGTGNSPVKMMNEWGIPTVYLESMLYDILKRMDKKGYFLPQVAITGGLTLEDHIFKGLALGAPYIQFVALGRAAMAAAMVGKQVGELIEAGNIPKEYKSFGSTKEEIFADIRELKLFYDNAEELPTGAVGVYSYISRIAAGMKQLMALNRKFDIKYIDRSDVFPLTDLAAGVTGLDTYEDVYIRELENL